MRRIVLISFLLVMLTATANATTFHGDGQRTGNFTAVDGKDLIWMQKLTSNFIESPIVAHK